MEEEIRAQLSANAEMLAGAVGEGPSWEEKVIHRGFHSYFVMISEDAG